MLGGSTVARKAGPRSAAELKEAATHHERAAALCNAPAGKADLVRFADSCRSRAELLERIREVEQQQQLIMQKQQQIRQRLAMSDDELLAAHAARRR